MASFRYKPRVYVSVNLLAGVWPPCWATRHRRGHAYAPMSNTASHENHEKINSIMSGSALYATNGDFSLSEPTIKSSSVRKKVNVKPNKNT